MEKIPFKRAELSARRFNDIAIPHHLGLLKNHKTNIEKNLALNNWSKVKTEEINAMRIIKQIKNLLLEMEALRERIYEEDVGKFDKLINDGKQKALNSIHEFLELQLKSPVSTPSSQRRNSTDVFLYDENLEDEVELATELPQLQTNFQEQQLLAKQACLEEFENIHREIEDLHSIFRDVHEIVHEQGEKIDVIADNAEEALENVQAGEENLRVALKYRKALYPLFGAVMGTCVGGPIGLIAGLKAGGLAALGCGVLGYTGGHVLKTNVTTGIKDDVVEEKKQE